MKTNFDARMITMGSLNIVVTLLSQITGWYIYDLKTIKYGI